MSFKEKLEKDPTRCRQLRKIEEEIERQRGEIVESLRRKRDETKLKRDQKRGMNERAKNLRVRIAGATVASVISGPVGNTIGANASSWGIELGVLESNIDATEKEIIASQNEIQSLQGHLARLDNSFKQNASELNALNCVV